jgi:hypothetical protein
VFEAVATLDGTEESLGTNYRFLMSPAPPEQWRTVDSLEVDYCLRSGVEDEVCKIGLIESELVDRRLEFHRWLEFVDRDHLDIGLFLESVDQLAARPRGRPTYKDSPHTDPAYPVTEHASRRELYHGALPGAIY